MHLKSCCCCYQDGRGNLIPKCTTALRCPLCSTSKQPKKQHPASPTHPVDRNQCAAPAAAVEGACLPSWVKHFDELQEKESRTARKVYNDIYQTASTSAGNLAGTAQK